MSGVRLDLMTDVWNDASVQYIGVGLDVTKSAAAAGSMLMSLKLNGVEMYGVDDTGIVYSNGVALSNFSAADATKLAGIEAGAQVNDNAGAILTKLLTVDGLGSGLDADKWAGNTYASILDQAVKTTSSPQFAAINVGHATDTTITRVSAGVIAVEGSNVLLASGLGSVAQAYNANLQAISELTTAADKLTYWTGSGAAAITDLTSVARTFIAITTVPLMRANLGLDAANSPQFATIELGAASDTTLSRVSAGVMAIEGVTVATSSNTLTLTNKTFDASSNTLSNIAVSMFAANVADTDSTLAANSNTRFATQAAIKSYVDNLVTGLAWKQQVRAATTANGTLATAYANGQVIDGVTLATGDRILLKNQTSGAENGIYVVAASGAPARATDADTSAEMVSATVSVRAGTTNADTQWTCTNDTITLGSTALVFAQMSGAGTYSASSGITLTGNAFTLTAASNAAYLNSVTAAANKLAYFNGSSSMATTDLTAVAITLIGQTTQALMRTTGLGSTTTGDALFVAASAAAARSTLGLDTGNSPQFTGATLLNSGGGAGLIIDGLAANSSYIQFNSATTPKWQLGRNLASGDHNFRLHNYAGGNDAVTFDVTTNAATFGSTITAASDIETGSVFRSRKASTPYFEWWETGAGADAKRWQMYTISGTFTFTSVTDAGSVRKTAFTADSATGAVSFPVAFTCATASGNNYPIIGAPNAAAASFAYQNAGATKWYVGRGPVSGANDFSIYNSAIGAVVATWADSTGYMTLGTGSASAQFAMNGGASGSGAGPVISWLLNGANLASLGARSSITGSTFDSTFQLFLGTGTAFAPYSDNAYTFGNGTYRWSTIYAATGTINTSDMREKTAFISSNDNDHSFAREVFTHTGWYQWLESVESKGANARLHYGPGAQIVESAALSRGIDPHRLGLFCEDDIGNGKTRKSLRMDQLQSLGIASLYAEIDALKAEIALLKAA